MLFNYVCILSGEPLHFTFVVYKRLSRDGEQDQNSKHIINLYDIFSLIMISERGCYNSALYFSTDDRVCVRGTIHKY